MATRYIEVDSNTFEQFLQNKGFVRSASENGKEVVYEFCHEYNPCVKIKVYTTIAAGKTIARDVGKDAIRIVTIYNDGDRSFGIAKFPRVYRTGTQDGVQERTLQHMREAYIAGSRWIRNNKAVRRE